MFGDIIMDSLFLLLSFISQFSITQMQYHHLDSFLEKVKQLNVNKCHAESLIHFM